MQAWTISEYSSIERLELSDLPRPEPGDEEVLVRVKAAALNPADLKVISGRDGGRFLHAPSFPLTPGYDFAGIVEETGGATKMANPGDEVFGFLPFARSNRQGTLAEYVAVPESTVAERPHNVSPAAAASAATVASTALQGLRDRARLQPGQTVLINGASGGVGAYATQMATATGATVWGTCSRSNMEFVAELGATEVIDYRALDFRNVRQRFDVIFDVASNSSMSACRPILARRGVYVTLLPSAGFVRDAVLSLFSPQSSRIVVVKSRRSDLAEIARGLETGQLQPDLAETFDFERAPEALWALESGEHRGKIAVAVEATAE